MITRRSMVRSTVGLMSFAHVAANAAPKTVQGIRIGVQSASFTFSGFDLDKIIKTMTDLQLDHIDTMSEHVENYLGAPVDLPGTGRSLPGPRPAQPATGASTEEAARQQAAMRQAMMRRMNSPEAKKKREDLRKWRLSVPLEKFRGVRAKFEDAGLDFYGYNLSFRDDFTEEEIERGFLMAKELGAKVITMSSPVSVLSRVVPYAEKYGIKTAVHNHSRIDENEIATPESFEKAIAMSKQMWINLDVGHFFAAGFDPVSFIKQHHGRITNIHLKDRKKDNGPSVALGEGDTPLKDILLLLRDSKFGIPVEIEHVGPDGPPVEIARCLAFCKEILQQ